MKSEDHKSSTKGLFQALFLLRLPPTPQTACPLLLSFPSPTCTRASLYLELAILKAGVFYDRGNHGREEHADQVSCTNAAPRWLVWVWGVTQSLPTHPAPHPCYTTLCLLPEPHPWVTIHLCQFYQVQAICLLFSGLSWLIPFYGFWSKRLSSI